MVRWLRWHCPPDTGFEIRALAVWGRARYLSVTEAPHNTNFHTWMGKKQFCFFQTAETGNRTPDSGVKGSGANHYPRAPARNSGRSQILFDNWFGFRRQRSHLKYVEAILFHWWPAGGRQALKQHWLNTSCFLGSSSLVAIIIIDAICKWRKLF